MRFDNWFAAFKALGKLILDVGLMLAYHCDQYGKFSPPENCNRPNPSLADIIFFGLSFWASLKVLEYICWGEVSTPL